LKLVCQPEIAVYGPLVEKALRLSYFTQNKRHTKKHKGNSLTAFMPFVPFCG